MPFAIIQSGHAIIGVGETEDETYAMAREFGDIPEDVPTSARSEGDVFIVGATPRLVRAVIENGGLIDYDVQNGVADIAED